MAQQIVQGTEISRLNNCCISFTVADVNGNVLIDARDKCCCGLCISELAYAYIRKNAVVRVSNHKKIRYCECCSCTYWCMRCCCPVKSFYIGTVNGDEYEIFAPAKQAAAAEQYFIQITGSPYGVEQMSRS